MVITGNLEVSWSRRSASEEVSSAKHRMKTEVRDRSWNADACLAQFSELRVRVSLALGTWS